MTDYFYLTENALNSEPECIKAVDYVHIKAKSDGTQTLILTEEQLTDDSLTLKTQAEAQALLDSWVVDENVDAPLDPEGNPTLQKNIGLGKFL